MFAAWQPENIGDWFGPDGFTTTTHEMDFTPGGVWRFNMNAPDGSVFPNKVVFTEIDPPAKIAFEHGADGNDIGSSIQISATFEESGGKTEMTFLMLFVTKEIRDEVAVFAVEGNRQTFDRLAAFLARE